MFLAMLLFIAAFFDTVQILDSKDDNDFFCSDKGKAALTKGGATIKLFECGFLRYYITVGLTFMSAVSLIISAYVANSWKLALPNVSDNL